MDENATTTTQTTSPTQVLTTAETPTGASTTRATGGDAGQSTQPAQTTQTHVVPDGYVKAEEIETERTARTAAEEARDAAIAERDRIVAEARRERIISVATRLGFNDPSDAERFIAADATDIESALKEVLEKKSYLSKPVEMPAVTPTSPTNPARQHTQAPTFTQAQIADRAFWNANKVAIMQAMKEGRISA